MGVYFKISNLTKLKIIIYIKPIELFLLAVILGIINFEEIIIWKNI